MGEVHFVEKQRIIQELVPGKEVTLAHIIANPDITLYEKLGLKRREEHNRCAIGVLTVSPGETAIIMADLAIKSADIELDFVDRVAGSVIITGSVSSVEASVRAICSFVKEVLGYSVVPITRT